MLALYEIHHLKLKQTLPLPWCNNKIFLFNYVWNPRNKRCLLWYGSVRVLWGSSTEASIFWSHFHFLLQFQNYQKIWKSPYFRDPFKKGFQNMVFQITKRLVYDMWANCFKIYMNPYLICPSFNLITINPLRTASLGRILHIFVAFIGTLQMLHLEN